jgi:hypothetical protein
LKALSKTLQTTTSEIIDLTDDTLNMTTAEDVTTTPPLDSIFVISDDKANQQEEPEVDDDAISAFNSQFNRLAKLSSPHFILLKTTSPTSSNRFTLQCTTDPRHILVKPYRSAR